MRHRAKTFAKKRRALPQTKGARSLKRHGLGSPATPKYGPGHRYRGLQGKVVEWVGHTFEEGLLYIYIRFVDKTELTWRIATRMTIEEANLADWGSGDFKRLQIFVQNERDTSA